MIVRRMAVLTALVVGTLGVATPALAATPHSAAHSNATASVMVRPAAAFTVTVKDLIGRTYEVPNMQSTNTVAELKDAIWDVAGYPPCQQTLAVGATILQDANTLGYYGITASTTVRLVLGLRC